MKVAIQVEMKAKMITTMKAAIQIAMKAVMSS